MEKGGREWATGFWHPRDFYKLDVLNSKMPKLQTVTYVERKMTGSVLMLSYKIIRD